MTVCLIRWLPSKTIVISCYSSLGMQILKQNHKEYLTIRLIFRTRERIYLRYVRGLVEKQTNQKTLALIKTLLGRNHHHKLQMHICAFNLPCPHFDARTSRVLRTKGYSKGRACLSLMECIKAGWLHFISRFPWRNPARSFHWLLHTKALKLPPNYSRLAHQLFSLPLSCIADRRSSADTMPTLPASLTRSNYLNPILVAC